MQKICSLICLISLLLGACKNDPNEAKKFADPENIQIDILENIRLLHKEKGYTDAIITAHLMHKYYKNENKITFPKGLQIELYQGDQMTAVIQCGYGERDDITKIIQASKGVTIVNYKKEKMESEELTWNEATAEIKVEGKVKVTTPTDIIEGYGLVSDDRFNNYKMSKITGILKVDGDNVPN